MGDPVINANEFSLVSKTILDPQHQTIRFNGVLAENENVMTKLQQMLAVATPDPGGEIERVQSFVTRTVPVGKQLLMHVVITCTLLENQP